MGGRCGLVTTKLEKLSISLATLSRGNRKGVAISSSASCYRNRRAPRFPLTIPLRGSERLAVALRQPAGFLAAAELSFSEVLRIGES